MKRPAFGRPFTIRAHLVTLVVVALVPVLVFAVTVVLRLNDGERETLKGATRETAQALLSELDRDLARALTALEVLGFSRHLDRDDLLGFRDDTWALLRSHPEWVTVTLSSPSGERLLTATQPYGLTSTLVSDAESVRSVARSQRPHVGALTSGPGSGWTNGSMAPLRWVCLGLACSALCDWYRTRAFSANRKQSLRRGGRLKPGWTALAFGFPIRLSAIARFSAFFSRLPPYVPIWFRTHIWPLWRSSTA